jgi:hypothetical protein
MIHSSAADALSEGVVLVAAVVVLVEEVVGVVAAMGVLSERVLEHIDFTLELLPLVFGVIKLYI